MALLPSMTVDTRRTLPCPDCGGVMVLFLAAKNFYVCTTETCSCRHFAHEDGDPLGTPADSSTREARTKAHAAFDPLWETKVFPNRSRAYTWLAKQLRIHPMACHMGLFDRDTCERVVAICSEYTAQRAKQNVVP